MKYFFVVLLSSLCLGVFAQTAQDFEIEKWDDEVTILKYLGNKKDIVIPTSIEGSTSLFIGEGAFREMGLTSVVIPDTVTGIGKSAFIGNQLTTLSIPGSVTSIGESAFSWNKLSRLDLGNGIIDIGTSTFSSNDLTNIAIPESVTSIGKSAFYGNSFTSITIPNKVKSVGDAAFNHTTITSITIGDNVSVSSILTPPFPHGFCDFYIKNGSKGGTFVYRQSRNEWVRR
jgi:hypothetical protein